MAEAERSDIEIWAMGSSTLSSNGYGAKHLKAFMVRQRYWPNDAISAPAAGHKKSLYWCYFSTPSGANIQNL
jgi:hypothetical protein